MSTHNTRSIQNVTTITQCWKITRQDNIILAFTEHDEDIFIDNIKYQAKGGKNINRSSSKDDCSANNSEVETMLTHSMLNHKDIVKGLYNDAIIESFFIDYTDLSEIKFKQKGKIKEITQTKNKFLAKIAPISSILNKNANEKYSLYCRTELGSSKCGVNTLLYTATNIKVSKVLNKANLIADNLIDEIIKQVNEKIARFITESQSNNCIAFSIQQYILTPTMVKNMLCNSVLTFISGQNQGYATEIRDVTQNGELHLTLAARDSIAIGDLLEIKLGCDKKFNTCCNIFHNQLNFRGEPHLPMHGENMKIHRI
jgi:hypothetical protein